MLEETTGASAPALSPAPPSSLPGGFRAPRTVGKDVHKGRRRFATFPFNLPCKSRAVRGPASAGNGEATHTAPPRFPLRMAVSFHKTYIKKKESVACGLILQFIQMVYLDFFPS